MIKKIFLLALCTVFYTINFAQTAGTLDSTFNGTGIYTHDFGFQDNLNDVTMQPDQKVICTGVKLTPAFSGELMVLRLNADGTPDSSFAANGVYSLLVGNETYGYESYVQPDGKILVAGITYDANYYADWLLLRLDSTGTLDSSFGTNGITMVDFFTRDDLAQAITVQMDGKILVSGTITDTISYYNNPAIVRFTSNGIVDSTFGTNGVATVAALDTDNELTSIAVQHDGKIVAAGHYSKVFTGAMDFDVLVVRVDSNGVLDPAFGANGLVKTSINGGIDDAFGMELDTAQNIIVCGFTTLPFSLTLDMVILKYNNAGTLDPGFGSSGIVTFNNSDEDVAYDLKIQPDNKIVVAGASGLGFMGPRSAAVWCYLSNGTPDSSFGTNGFVTTDINPTLQDYNSMTLAADGKIVCAGKTNNGSQNDIAVVRYYNDLYTLVNEINNTFTFSAYPNPVSAGQTITLDFENDLTSAIKLQLTDVTGKEIAIEQTAMVKKYTGIKIPAAISPGIYFLTIQTGKSPLVKKLIVR